MQYTTSANILLVHESTNNAKITGSIVQCASAAHSDVDWTHVKHSTQPTSGIDKWYVEKWDSRIR